MHKPWLTKATLTSSFFSFMASLIMGTTSSLIARLARSLKSSGLSPSGNLACRPSRTGNRPFAQCSSSVSPGSRWKVHLFPSAIPKFCSLRSGEETSSGRVDSGWANWIAWAVLCARRSGEAMMWANGVVDKDSPTALACCLSIILADYES